MLFDTIIEQEKQDKLNKYDRHSLYICLIKTKLS